MSGSIQYLFLVGARSNLLLTEELPVYSVLSISSGGFEDDHEDIV